MSLKRLVKNKTGRDYLKSFPTSIPPSLRDAICKSLVEIDPRFGLYFPRAADDNVDAERIMEVADVNNVYKYFNGNVEQIKKLKCYGPEMREKLIVSDYKTFFDMDETTISDYDVKLFFKNLPPLKSIPTEYIDRIKQLASRYKNQPFVVSYPCLFELIETCTISVLLEQVKQTKLVIVDETFYQKMRNTINESAANQLEAIEGGLCTNNFRPSKPLLNSSLYEPFKSKECIYAWIKQKHRYIRLPDQFASEQVLVEVVKLGNEDVFRYWPPDKLDETCLIECLDANSNLIVHVPTRAITPNIRDFILSKSPKYFKHIPDNLQTKEWCRTAVYYSPVLFTRVADKFCSSELVDIVIEELLSMFAAGKNIYFLADIVLKFSHESKWSMLKRAIKTDEMLSALIDKNLIDTQMAEYIVNHTTSLPFLMRNISFFEKNLQPSVILSLVERAPELIQNCSKDFLEKYDDENGRVSQIIVDVDIGLYKYCKKTPKIIEFLCQQDYKVLRQIKEYERTKILDMFMEHPILFQHAWKYSREIMSYRKLDFRTCSILLRGAISIDCLRNTLFHIYRENNWLLYKCFRIACFSSPNELLPNWQQNVEALGEIVEFDAAAVYLVLSFQDDKTSRNWNHLKERFERAIDDGESVDEDWLEKYDDDSDYSDDYDSYYSDDSVDDSDD